MNFTYEADKQIKVSCTNGNLNIGKVPDQKAEPGFYLYNTIVMINCIEKQIKTLMGQITNAKPKVLGYTELMDKGLDQKTANEAMLQEVNTLRGIHEYLAKNMLGYLAQLCFQKYQPALETARPEPDPGTTSDTPQNIASSSGVPGQQAL